MRKSSFWIIKAVLLLDLVFYLPFLSVPDAETYVRKRPGTLGHKGHNEEIPKIILCDQEKKKQEFGRFMVDSMPANHLPVIPIV